MKQNSWLKVGVLVLALTFTGGVLYYYHPGTPVPAASQGPIYEFDEQRDMNAIIDLFLKDWYWLSARDYSESRIREHFHERSPNEYEPRFFGQMRIKVLREDTSLVGFVTYYMKNFYAGHILYLSVDANFRGKRYGQKLLDFAINDLKSMGAKIVTLAVRSSNQSALKLYTRMGFVPAAPDADGFINCTLSLE